MKIWCLFSVANEYDQPEYTLVTWWSTRPTIERLAAFLCYPLDKCADQDVIAITEVWRGHGARLSGDDTRYRLEEVEECKA